jgi:hypothetical protein
MPNLNLRSKTHYWKETNRNKIIKLLAFFLLQGLHKELDNKSYFSWRKILETPIFVELFSERFHPVVKFLHFVYNGRSQRREIRHNCENCGAALYAVPFPILSYGDRLLEA